MEAAEGTIDESLNCIFFLCKLNGMLCTITHLSIDSLLVVVVKNSTRAVKQIAAVSGLTCCTVIKIHKFSR